MYKTVVCSLAHKYQISLQAYAQGVHISIFLRNTVSGMNFKEHQTPTSFEQPVKGNQTYQKIFLQLLCSILFKDYIRNIAFTGGY